MIDLKVRIFCILFLFFSLTGKANAGVGLEVLEWLNRSYYNEEYDSFKNSEILRASLVDLHKICIDSAKSNNVSFSSASRECNILKHAYVRCSLIKLYDGLGEDSVIEYCLDKNNRNITSNKIAPTELALLILAFIGAALIILDILLKIYNYFRKKIL